MMRTKILIVEDQFIEANGLKIMLDGAGYEVCGIAKTYEQAVEFISDNRPEIVLLDIRLKGNLTGLDLALVLNEENIPFIYLSANSNASTLEEAKATRPYGFLVKPYREKDLLVALDIAGYRHTHATKLVAKQEEVLRGILQSILNAKGTPAERLFQIVKAFSPYIPFDGALIDVDILNPDLNVIYEFIRTGFDEYEINTGWDTLKRFEFDYDAYNRMRKNSITSTSIKIENADDFDRAIVENPVLASLKNKFGYQSRLIAPLLEDGKLSMGMRFYSKEAENFKVEHTELLNSLKSLLSMIFHQIRDQKLASDETGVVDLMFKAIKGGEPFKEGIVGKSARLLRALDQAAQVANFDMSVLILGETGVGKEGLVKLIHQHSQRRNKPFIKINCAAIPNSLIESELFGHEKGSFTGAFERKIGKFEQAHGGTIFLDEIGEIPLEIQTKLLRVLQEKEFERIGGRATIQTDVRIIAATNRNLHEDVAAGKFRMDLYYRINVFPILLAPLRERLEDIPLLTSYFLELHARKTNQAMKTLSSEVLHRLMNYSWPGNIRELQHVIERNIVLNQSSVITSIELPNHTIIDQKSTAESETFRSIAEVDRAHIIAALKKCNGKVSGKGGAAEMLNIPATTLNSKMKKLDISWKYK